MPTLHAALAFAERHRVAVRVTEDLHFDVTRRFEVALEVDATITECGQSAIGAGLRGALELGELAHDLHADAATARGGFDQQRQTDAFGFCLQGQRCPSDRPAAHCPEAETRPRCARPGEP